jgi:methionyl-tRNA synthetase
VTAKPFYITTAINYPNGPPHIGHAYEAIATDAIARFERCDGKSVLFVTGTDEHGLKMKQTAEREGLSPLALADRNSAVFRAMAEALLLSNDDFVRTSEDRHTAASVAVWKRMAAANNGDIFKKTYGGWYSVRDEVYYKAAETEVGEDGARRSVTTGTPVEWNEEETFFFRLSAYEDRLLKHYEENPEFILPLERRNEVISFVKSGLEDLSISRSTLDWGIPVPGAPGHVMYVWVDALTTYLTGTGFPDEANPRYRAWPADVHMIGKDITRFHAVYWPAFLMSAGLPVPERIFSHGFVLNRGEKMSKSVGNVLDPFDLVKAFGAEPVRYFFLREIVFGQDGSYSKDAIVNRINADLANNLGNLAQRSLSMINKNCEGRVPQPGVFSPADEAMLAAADGLYAQARAAMDKQAITRYLDAVWAVLGEANRYFDAEAPWSLKKTDPARMATVLYVTAEVVRQVAILIQPVLPQAGAKLLEQLAQGKDGRSFAALGAGGRLVAGTTLPAPAGVFPRYVDPDEAPPAEAKPAKSPKQPKPPKQPKAEA